MIIIYDFTIVDNLYSFQTPRTVKIHQYTIEFENENKQLSLLDVTITNTGNNNSFDFKLIRRTSITNVQTKPNSNIAPNVAIRLLKGFLSRAYKTDFLIDILTENRHNRNTLTNIATEYLRNINKPKSNGQNNTKNTKSIIKLPWVLILAPKLRKDFRKKYIKTVFTSGANLKQSILRQNKSKILPSFYAGFYALNCSCNAEYVGKNKKKVMTRTIEHQQDSIMGKWESSCVTEHSLQRHGQFNWLQPNTLSRGARYKSRKIRESL